VTHRRARTTFVAVAVVVCAGACSTPSALQLDAGAPSNTANAPDAGDAGVAIYHGFVLAKTTQGAASDSFAAFADFASGGTPFDWTGQVGDHPVAGGCACVQGIATPDPFQMPDAAAITITGPTGGVVARLDPSGVIVDGGTVSSTLHGTSDLGSLWYVFPGDYPYVDAAPWSAGEVLQVTAPGAAVHGFSGALRAGGRLAVRTPSLGNAAPLVIARDRDLQLSWTPDAIAGETVLLGLRQVALDSIVSCFCAAPDQSGTLALPATLLALYAADPGSCNLELERLNVTTVSSGNATIQLVGATAVATTATVP
jgi:hypothetical protein